MKSDRTRGRPLSFDRAAALEAALDLFWRSGYDATSVAELTAAMKITPPSLYAAFGSKKDLFLEAVALYERQHGLLSLRALQDEGCTAKQAFERCFAFLAESSTNPEHPAGCFIVLAATNCCADSQDVEKALRDKRRASEKILCDRIVRGIEQGELPADTNAAELAKFYGAVIQGIAVQARDGASREDLEAIARRALDAWPSAIASAPKKKANGVKREHARSQGE
ncbi:TetR/AcrR family transcriptional regulator [Pendulispora rubella]|uniref:TetR/AcrR family transcriptional regulator n=1 Tax=Pendulispora rubella TaxID=2741070 RepID=A0ABZ2LAQ3_9BACT